MYDIIIIGAGPAGLTAAIYARRAGKHVLLLEKNVFGGQITYSPKVENYPGCAALSGNELAEQMTEQMLETGAEAIPATVLSIRDAGYTKYVMTDAGEYETKSIIIATGARHRHLGVPNEERLIGRGVSYCAVCDGAFYAGRTVAVIGGGNTALQEALLLSDICKRVYVIQNLAKLTGEANLAQALRARSNVTILCNSVVDDVTGTEDLDGVRVRKTTDDTVARLAVDGVFVCIGQVPETEAFADQIQLDKNGYVPSGEDCLTPKAGIFVAGDCRTKAVRQITTATADGAVAALAAIKYLESFT
ncbi:MAG: FAD-dependent oxidoreductase [Clostridia bacterium]|nr:FAD-dependent oxidoreductase [Clostridia bacterium]